MGSITISPTNLNGVHLINAAMFLDNRGGFTKIFQKEEFDAHCLQSDFSECYYSTSRKGVVRGMHFQIPPHEHAKLIYVTSGKITDVVLDIRRNSSTYGKFFSTELSSRNGLAIYISPGFAHGFESLENDSCVTYLQTSVHEPEFDMGIHFNSFEMNWETSHAIVSERDSNFPSLQAFNTPFEI